MAERKNTSFERPGGYATPKGATHVQARAAKLLKEATDLAMHGGHSAVGGIRLDGDAAPRHEP